VSGGGGGGGNFFFGGGGGGKRGGEGGGGGGGGGGELADIFIFGARKSEVFFCRLRFYCGVIHCHTRSIVLSFYFLQRHAMSYQPIQSVPSKLQSRHGAVQGTKFSTVSDFAFLNRGSESVSQQSGQGCKNICNQIESFLGFQRPHYTRIGSPLYMHDW